MADEKNEFDDISVEEETVPEQEFSKPVTGQDDLISSGTAGVKYDWSQAPEGVKAPPRVVLNGKTVTIKKADIVLPPKNRDWVKSRSGTSEYKYCTFVLYYDVEGQQEFYSGVRVFRRDDEMYSHPTIMRDRKNQASKLLGIYADHKKKDINEVSLREFMGFLNGQPKAVIKTEDIMNPTTNETIKKNFVESFVSN